MKVVSSSPACGLGPGDDRRRLDFLRDGVSPRAAGKSMAELSHGRDCGMSAYAAGRQRATDSSSGGQGKTPRPPADRPRSRAPPRAPPTITSSTCR